MISKIEIRPIKMGFRSTPEGSEFIYNPDLAMLLADYDGTGRLRQVGYVWYKPRHKISCECYTPSDQEAAVLTQLVEEETGLEFEKTLTTFPPLIEDEDDEEDDEEE